VTPNRITSVPENSSPDAEAQLASLYAAIHAPLSRFVLKLTLGDQQLAEDIVQETFVRAWRYLSRHPEASAETFRPWLYTVARRLVIDTIRARRARPPEYITDDLTRIASIDNDIDAFIIAESIHDALLALNPEHRTILIELYYRGRSIAELAADLNVPTGTIKSRSYYAKQALQALLSR
jgi:RNA polymerase sigma-70 factor, ECF subfamily